METLRVLATDDEPGMLMAVERVLRSFTVRGPDVETEVGFTVEKATTGEEAVARIEADRPDILLLDYKLPGMSGLDVLEQVATREDEMLTIMMTAYASLETAVTATKRGAYDFLAKPFTPDELTNTVRKAASRLLLAQQARRLAAEKRQVRFQFISVLAHELKSPLAAIEGYVRLCRDRSAGDDQAAYDQMLDRTLVRVEGMRKLIFDLLDLTRIESGQKKRSFDDVDLREVAETAIENVLPEAGQRDITVELHMDEPVTMTADRGEIQIVLNNLVSNAVKYNRDGGRVDVTIDRQDDAVRIRVADTGIGMTDEEAAKLFGDFVRIKNEKTRNILGSGLGLSTVQKLARLYDGEVSVESEPDVGSTFTVLLREPTEASPEE
ncbi:MAG: sensor histidine kinase [Planctomycetota bacterium]